MADIDVIEFSLNAPIDWARFERVVFELLSSDDLPTLRKVGGPNDLGIDAEEAFFIKEEDRIVVQVTSQKTQFAKVKDTISKLKRNGIDPKTLVVVFRQLVSSKTRRDMQTHAVEEGVMLDLRDQSYLISRLSKEHSIFARYFRSPREQLKTLLEDQDPA